MYKGGVCMFKGLLRVLVIISILSGTVGCSGAGTDPKSKAQTYPQDGYMGITSVNPNQPLNPTYHHYRDDTNLMKAVLAQIPGIADSQIQYSGPDVEVRLKLNHQVNTEQAEEIRSAAQMALQTNMPRYKVKVYINGR